MKITNYNLDCTLISLFPHNVCNFSCSYCTPYHYDGKNRWPDSIQPYLDFINETKKTNKYTYVEIVGGEPTLWPKLHELINELNDGTTFVELNSNASRTFRYWETFNNQKCYTILSWHSEGINDDHYYRVAEILSHKGPVFCHLLTTPNNFSRAKEIYERFESSNLEVSCQSKFVRTSISAKTYFDYTDEQRQWILDAGVYRQKPWPVDWYPPWRVKVNNHDIVWNHMVDGKAHKFQNWICKAGINRFMIAPDGTITRCTRNVGGELGNIFKEYNLPTKPILCSSDSCTCKQDAIIEKWIDDDTKVNKQLIDFLKEKSIL